MRDLDDITIALSDAYTLGTLVEDLRPSARWRALLRIRTLRPELLVRTGPVVSFYTTRTWFTIDAPAGTRTPGRRL